jgi:hypothetical protein
MFCLQPYFLRRLFFFRIKLLPLFLHPLMLIWPALCWPYTFLCPLLVMSAQGTGSPRSLSSHSIALDAECTGHASDYDNQAPAVSFGLLVDTVTVATSARSEHRWADIESECGDVQDPPPAVAAGAATCAASDMCWPTVCIEYGVMSDPLQGDASYAAPQLTRGVPIPNHIEEALDPNLLYKPRNSRQKTDGLVSMAVATFRPHLLEKQFLQDCDVHKNIIITSETTWSSHCDSSFYSSLGYCLRLSSTILREHLVPRVGYPCVAAYGVRVASQLLRRSAVHGILLFHAEADVVVHLRPDGSAASYSYALGYTILMALDGAVALLYQPYHYFPLHKLRNSRAPPLSSMHWLPYPDTPAWALHPGPRFMAW